MHCCISRLITSYFCNFLHTVEVCLNCNLSIATSQQVSPTRHKLWTVAECPNMAGTIINDSWSFGFTQHAYDMQIMLEPIPYKAITLTPETVTGKFASSWSCIGICIILAGSCKEQDSSCKACKFACSYLSLNFSSQEVAWKQFTI